MTSRREFSAVLASAGLLGLISRPLMAQTPAVARIYVGFPAGGTADALSRRLADKLRGTYAPTVVVENKPGAGGQIAVTTLRDSAPDGSTLLVTPSSLISMNNYTFAKLPYKPLTDVTAVSLLCHFDHAFAVGPAVPASVKTLKDFLDWAKVSNAPGYGTPGSAGIPHLIGVLLSKRSGVAMTNIPYRGTAPTLQDLMGGQVPAAVVPVGDYLPYMSTGKIRVLAVAGPKRSSFLPEVPTMRESSIDIEARDWFGVFMPARTPASVVARASSDIQAALGDNELRQSLIHIGMEPTPSTPAALTAMAAREDGMWGRIIKEVGFVPE